MRSLLCLGLLVPMLHASAAVKPCVLSGPEPARPAITGIAFTAFQVSDNAAADRFYSGELGFKPVVGEDGSTVYPVNGRQWIQTSPGDASPRKTRLAAVGLMTPDVAAMQQYLAARGYASRQGVVSAGGCKPVVANRRLTVHDPEGNTIVFVDANSGKRPATDKTIANAISRRIIHAGFVVQSEAAENSFYRDVLGFKPYWRGGHNDESTDYVSQQVPDGTDWLEYMLNVKPEATAAQRGVSNHVSLGVSKMDTAIAQLARNGCTTDECTASKLGRDGKVQLNLYDPDHSRVEVMEFSPTGPTCCSPYTGPMPKADDPQY